MRLKKKYGTLPEPIRVLIRLVVIPMVCVFLAVLILLYAIGGMELLRLVVSLFTLRVALKTFAGMVGLAAYVLVRHYAPGPLQNDYRSDSDVVFRKSLRVNLIEALALIGVIACGIWALRRY
jgi:hypothetical protein